MEQEPAEPQTEQPDEKEPQKPATAQRRPVLRGGLDLRDAGLKVNDIVSGRIQKVFVDGDKFAARDRLACDDGGYFDAVTSNGTVRCVLAAIEQTRHGMKATLGISGQSIDVTTGDDPISLVMFRKA